MSDSALSTTATIVNQRGLHARAAAKFVRVLEDFTAEIVVAKGSMQVSGRSIMGLMLLAAACGTQLKLSASGADAAGALQALKELIERKFDEDE